VILAILLAAAAHAPAAAPGTDYLANIRAGKLLCAGPDAATKTCSNLESYVLANDGTVADTGETLLAPNPVVTLETTSTVRVDGTNLCGMLELADLQKGKVRVNGELLPADRNAIAIGKIVDAVGSIVGHKVCESLHVDGGVLTKSGTIEGIDTKIPDKAVAWVSPSDGYKVGAPVAPPAAPGQ
jgi:hypothetical protein